MSGYNHNYNIDSSNIISSLAYLATEIRDELSYEEIQAAIYKDMKFYDIKQDSTQKFIDILYDTEPELIEYIDIESIRCKIKILINTYRKIEKDLIKEIDDGK